MLKTVMSVTSAVIGIFSDKLSTNNLLTPPFGGVSYNWLGNVMLTFKPPSFSD